MNNLTLCDCPHSVQLICEATREMDVGTTIWRHGGGEAAMVVFDDMWDRCDGEPRGCADCAHCLAVAAVAKARGESAR